MSRTEQVLEAIAGRRPSSSGWVRANCPFCVLTYGKTDRTQALSLNAASGKWHCFRCGERGRITPEDVGSTSRVATQPHETTPEQIVDQPEGFIPLGEEPGLSAMATKAVRDYLLNDRKVPVDVWRWARIGTTLSGRFAHRVIVPVLRPDGAWLGWVARAITKTDPKRYLNSSGSIPGVFNEQALYQETDEPVVLVEGCFDALPLWPDGVALLGKPNELRFHLLLNARRPIAVCLDGDAWVEGEALAWRLQFEGKCAGYVHLPPLKDPDDCRDTIRAQARACVKEARCAG